MYLSDLVYHGELVRERLDVDTDYARLAQRHAAADALSIILVAFRAQHELSVAALARRLGWSRSHVARLERGDAVLRVDELAHLARHGLVRVAIDECGVAVEPA